jgi:hypothetical protein
VALGWKSFIKLKNLKKRKMKIKKFGRGFDRGRGVKNYTPPSASPGSPKFPRGHFSLKVLPFTRV